MFFGTTIRNLFKMLHVTKTSNKVTFHCAFYKGIGLNIQISKLSRILLREEYQNPQNSQHPIHGIGVSENIRANSKNKKKQMEIFFLNLCLLAPKSSVPHGSHSSGCLENQALFIMICKGPS
jgi:hypothetical protein